MAFVGGSRPAPKIIWLCIVYGGCRHEVLDQRYPPLIGHSRSAATILATLAFAIFAQGESCEAGPVTPSPNNDINVCVSNDGGDCTQRSGRDQGETGLGDDTDDNDDDGMSGPDFTWPCELPTQCVTDSDCAAAYPNDPCNVWACKQPERICWAEMLGFSGDLECPRPEGAPTCVFYGCKIAQFGVSPIRAVCAPSAVTPGSCLIDGECYDNGEENPDEACQICTASDFHENIGLNDGPWRSWSNNDGYLCDEENRPLAECVEQACVCEPDCDGRTCGPDGCGGTCGELPAEQTWGQCVDEILCSDQGTLVTSYKDSNTPCNDNKQCTIDDNCDGNGGCVGTCIYSDASNCDEDCEARTTFSVSLAYPLNPPQDGGRQVHLRLVPSNANLASSTIVTEVSTTQIEQVQVLLFTLPSYAVSGETYTAFILFDDATPGCVGSPGVDETLLSGTVGPITAPYAASIFGAAASTDCTAFEDM